MIKVSGKDFQGSGGFVKVKPGTYPCVLVGAKMYKNENFDKDAEVVQIGLVWDTGLIGKRDDGSEADMLIFDDWITFSLNEKANLTKRFKALAAFDEKTADLEVEFEGGEFAVASFDELPHWRERKVNVTSLKLNGAELFGKEALVSVTHNTAGYVKVAGVTAPLAAPQDDNVRKRPAGMPA